MVHFRSYFLKWKAIMKINFVTSGLNSISKDECTGTWYTSVGTFSFLPEECIHVKINAEIPQLPKTRKRVRNNLMSDFYEQSASINDNIILKVTRFLIICNKNNQDQLVKIVLVSISSIKVFSWRKIFWWFKVSRE